MLMTIRDEMGLTQAMFVAQFGFSISTPRNWEREKRKPDPSARARAALDDALWGERETFKRAM